MYDKLCPICIKTEWDYDVIDVITGFIFCGDCHQLTEDAFQDLKKKGVKGFEGWITAIPEAFRRNKARLDKQEPIES